jgi:hypothetical protein
MAEVLTIREETINTNLRTEIRYRWLYNGYIYYVYDTTIYKYDYINDTLHTEAVVSYGGLYSTFSSVLYDNALYIVSHRVTPDNTRYVLVSKYDLLTGSFTQSYRSASFSTTTGVSTDNMSIISHGEFIYILWGGNTTHLVKVNLASGGTVNIYTNDTLRTASQMAINNNVGAYVGEFRSKNYRRNNDAGYTTFGATYPTDTDLTSGIPSAQRIALSGAASIYRNGHYYFIGGRKYTASSTYTNNLNIYDFNPTAYTISNIGKISGAIMDDYACQIDNNTYVIFSGKRKITISWITYNLTYDIKNGSGSTTYASHTDASPITKVRFGASGSTVSYIITTLTGTITGTYTSATPSGKQLTGFALSPNSSSVIIPLDTDVTLSRTVDTTFYETYETYKPPATTFNINTYHNTAEPNRVDKSSFLEAVSTLSGALRAPCSLINPSILIQQTTVPQFNYVHIPSFGRYYFVTNITAVNQKLWQIDLKCDVLMTYKSGVHTLSAIIGRQENDYNADLNDTDLPIEKGVDVNIEEFSTTPFDTTTDTAVHNYVLVVVGA